jgi:hypothetical protein
MSIDPQAVARPQIHLPTSEAIILKNKAFRQRVTKRFVESRNPTPQPNAYSHYELTSKIGALLLCENPVERMRNFFEDEVLRIVDLWHATASPIWVSEQLGELRLSLVAWAFRLAIAESPGNMALLVGGSTIHGSHTLLTDVDLVILPHTDEDRLAARNVQALMTSLLVSIGIKENGFLSNSIGYLTMEQILDKVTLKVVHNKLFRADSPPLRVLLDAQVIDVAQADSAASPDHISYEKKFAQFQTALTSLLQERILATLRELLHEKLSETKDLFFDIKNNPLRLFQYALYAAKIRWKIKESNFWLIINELDKRGYVNPTTVESVAQALRFFVTIRHLLAFSDCDNKTSESIQERMIPIIAQALGLTSEELDQQIARHRNTLVDTATNLLKA